jgi:hypothetical protein
MKVTSNPARASSAPTPAPFAPTLMAAILWLFMLTLSPSGRRRSRAHALRLKVSMYRYDPSHPC